VPRRDLTYRRADVNEPINPARDVPLAQERWRRVAPPAFRALADDVPLDEEDQIEP
jgi:hypothetical protein